MKVLVTRPAAQAAEWVARLHERGVTALALPLLDILPAPDAAAVVAAWSHLDAHSLLVFVSPNAAEQFFALRPAQAAWPQSTRAASTGPGTSQALLRLGVPRAQLVGPADDAAQFDSEALWAQLANDDWHDRRVLIVRGDGGRDWLAETLRAHGARVAHLAAYRRGPPRWHDAEHAVLAAALAAPADHLWLFSSSEAIDQLVATAGEAGWRAARAIATHPRIAARARQAGFGSVTLSRPELDAVVACIQSAPPIELA